MNETTIRLLKRQEDIYFTIAKSAKKLGIDVDVLKERVFKKARETDMTIEEVLSQVTDELKYLD
ncbi:hypothetical protein JCM19046_3544 [Bacillus sp. JCM 19046]|nr:hypothetical protein JCM19045_4232 [Bacillus sp. JCM 19045]GAF18931.1 hypothetical protein JCM19046_3544 [Bacillus sp. JCM 19046]